VDPLTTVAIVVDPAFGDQIRDLPPQMPVWVLDTPINRQAAHRFWPDGAEASSGRNITTFIGGDESAEDSCIRILPTVDTHHNALAQKPPYSAIEVFGARLTTELRRALEEYGFLVVQADDSHFIAREKSQVVNVSET
jgi:hypothetical protein